MSTDAPDAAPRVWRKGDPAIPSGAIYVGRPSPWGNPYRIGKDGSREEVIALYRWWLDNDPALRERAAAQLRGHDLVCWCAPLPCHADVLLEVANAVAP